MVGTTISGNCSFGRVTNWVNPIADIMIARMYTATWLSMAQLVGLNSLIFFTIPSVSFIYQYFGCNYLLALVAMDCPSYTDW